LATLTLDGVNRGQIPVYFKNGKERYLGGEFQDGVEPYPGVDIPRTWGSGVAQLTNIVVFTTKGGVASQTPVGGASHRFFVRKNIKVMRADNIGLLIKRSNNTVTFKAQRIRIINPSTGKYQSAGSVKLQYRSDGVWRTTKTIRLNSLGDGSFSRTISRKYPYRLRIAKTSRNIEFLTKVSGRI
ncbi:MAG: hypothetical protein JWQ91_2713, partial [Aeromicrobium sp.]|uniref:hypothetical protein n=1 Tax=Aeromicrobium sp. TaxID=1871063 RepID=UPI002616C905